MMRYIALAFLFFFPFTVQAAGLYTERPHCAVLKNESKGTAFVAIRTDFYTAPDGSRSYYEEVIHLKEGQEREICAKGPFLPDYKVTLIVKSLFPLYECKTKLTGTIPIRERPDKEGGRDVYAVCVD